MYGDVLFKGGDATMEQQQTITIDAAGVARFTRTLVQPGGAGQERKTHVLETRAVDARTLFSSMEQRGLPCLPAGCRFYDRNDTHEIFVIEEPPQVRTVVWKPWAELQEHVLQRRSICRQWRMSKDSLTAYLKRTHFALAFPYVVKCYVMRDGFFDRLLLFYRCKPLAGEGDELLVPNLPNCGANYVVCMPRKMQGCHVGTGAGASAAIVGLERAFWGSTFNSDLANHFVWYAHRVLELATPWDWERASQRDPSFVLRMQWQSANCTVQDTVRSIVAEQQHGAVFVRLLDRLRRAADGGMHGAASHGAAAPAAAPAAATLLAPHQEQEVDEVRLGEHTITPGTLLRFTDAARWPQMDRGMSVVDHISRDHDGTVSVQCPNHWARIPISVDGALAHGITVLPPERTTRFGTLAAAVVTLGDGTTLRKGDRLFDRAREREVVVETFLPYGGAANEPGLRRARLSGHVARIEDPDGGINPNFIPLLHGLVQEVRVGRRTIRIGDALRWRGAVVRVGKLLGTDARRWRYVQFEGSRTWHRLVLGNALDWSSMVPPECRVAADGASVQLGRTTYRADQAFFDTASAALHVCTSFAARGPGVVDAVCVRGDVHQERCIPFIRDWELADGLQLVRSSFRVGSVELSRGMRLRLRVTTPEHEAGAIVTVHHVREIRGAVMVVFDDGLGVRLTPAHARCFDAAAGHYWQQLRSGRHAAARALFTRVFYPPGTTPLVRAGRVVGKDRTGKPIRVGDRVRVVRQSEGGSPRFYGSQQARVLARNGHAFTVVHAVRLDWSSNHILYLDARRCVGSYQKREERDLIGYRALPAALKQDEVWWSRICLARHSAVEFVRSARARASKRASRRAA